MSRSYKKSPAGGCGCSPSEKEDKQRGNRKFRRISKQLINQGKEPLYNINQAIPLWEMAKDGHVWYGTEPGGWYLRKYNGDYNKAKEEYLRDILKK